VGVTGLNLTAANDAVMTQKFLVFNEQWQAFAGSVQLGLNRVLHAWVLNTDPGSYDSYLSDLHHHSGVVQLRVLHNVLSQLNIKMTMIYQILMSREDHKKQLMKQGNNLLSDEPSS
jgi:hypothetical protein